MRTPIIGLSLCIFFFSCEKKSEKNPYLDIKISEETPATPYEQLKYRMIFPDTVLVDKPYKATIEFESYYDTIIDPVQINPHDSTKVRLITFYYFESFKKTMEPTELVLIDSAFVLNKYFELDNVIFTEKGEFVFAGLIEDRIMYNHYNEKGIRDSVHFSRLKQQIFKNVVVVDK